MIKLRGKKKKLLEALHNSLGVVSAACKEVNISRDTHYRWLREDENYKDWVNLIPDVKLDFGENALLKQIQAGNTPATIFFLKTKGKSRGYGESQQIEMNTNVRGDLQITQLLKDIKDGNGI